MPQISAEDETYEEIELRLRGGRASGVEFEMRSPRFGVTRGSFSWPFVPGEVEQALLNVERFSKNWVGRRGISAHADPIQEMGRTLFQVLFDGESGDLYRKAEGRVRLRLVMQDQQVSKLPWEFLYDPLVRDFVALSAHRSLVREWSNNVVWNSRTFETPPIGPLKVLHVSANLGAETIDGFQQEVEILEQIEQRGHIRLEVATAVRANQFRQLLANGMHEVVIFGGKGMTAADCIEPEQQSLGFHSGSHLRQDWQPVDDSELMQILGSRDNLRLLYLGACYTDELARKLAQVVPATIGLRGSLLDSACVTFLKRLMELVAEGHWLDTAVTFARREIDQDSPGSRIWGVPVFYMGVAKGIRLCPAKQSPQGIEIAGVSEASQLASNAEVRSTGRRSVGSAASAVQASLVTKLAIEKQNLAELESLILGFADRVPPAFLNDQLQDTKGRVAAIEQQLQAMR